MNKKALAPLIAIAIQSFVSQSTMAADSTVNVTGNVVASACTVDTGSVNMGIALGDVSATVLAAAASASPWSIEYDITLINCPSTTTKVNATFTGTADTNDTNGYKNAGTGGSAAVSVQLAKLDGTTYLKNGTAYGDVAVVAGKASIPVKARMYTKAGSVMPGVVSSAILVAFSYK